jgi:hypothetical protein
LSLICTSRSTTDHFLLIYNSWHHGFTLIPHPQYQFLLFFGASAGPLHWAVLHHLTEYLGAFPSSISGLAESDCCTNTSCRSTSGNLCLYSVHQIRDQVSNSLAQHCKHRLGKLRHQLAGARQAHGHPEALGAPSDSVGSHEADLRCHCQPVGGHLCYRQGYQAGFASALFKGPFRVVSQNGKPRAQAGHRLESQ